MEGATTLCKGFVACAVGGMGSNARTMFMELCERLQTSLRDFVPSTVTFGRNSRTSVLGYSQGVPTGLCADCRLIRTRHKCTNSRVREAGDKNVAQGGQREPWVSKPPNTRPGGGPAKTTSAAAPFGGCTRRCAASRHSLRSCRATLRSPASRACPPRDGFHQAANSVLSSSVLDSENLRSVCPFLTLDPGKAHTKKVVETVFAHSISRTSTFRCTKRMNRLEQMIGWREIRWDSG